MNPMKESIKTLDMEPIRIKLTMPNEKGGFNWPLDAANDAIMSYLDFLNASYEHFSNKAFETDSEKLSPDAIVDIVWHTHILFTQKYHEDCDRIFGHYLHHQPAI